MFDLWLTCTCEWFSSCSCPPTQIMQGIQKALSALITVLKNLVFLFTAIELTVPVWVWNWKYSAAALPFFFQADTWVKKHLSSLHTVENQMQKFIQVMSIFWDFRSWWTDVNLSITLISLLIKPINEVIMAIFSACFCSFLLRCLFSSWTGMSWGRSWAVEAVGWKAAEEIKESAMCAYLFDPDPFSMNASAEWAVLTAGCDCRMVRLYITEWAPAVAGATSWKAAAAGATGAAGAMISL